MHDEAYPALQDGVTALGDRHFVRGNGHGGFLWWHDCPVTRAWGWFGQGSTETSGHVIESREPLTVGGSLICTKCGDHGFIRAGRWEAC